MKLAVKYRGPDVDRGRMSALDLGPAIFGIGEMVGQASRILYKDGTRVRVEVNADFPHASFGIEFYAVASGADLLSSLSLAQLAQICGVLGFGVTVGKGVRWLLQWQRGRKIDKVEKDGDGLKITIADQSEHITINEYNFFIDPTIRRGFKALVDPLESEGIKEVSIQAGDAPPDRIQRDDRASYTEAPLPEDLLSTDKSTAVLEIVSLSFRPGNKWRFSQGGGTFHAAILDEHFLQQVAVHRELFGSGDALRVEMEIRTVREGAELRFEHTITRVLEHIPAEKGGGQLPL